MFEDVYVDLGIDLGELGCIMLDTEKIVVSDVINEADYYTSDKHEYVAGNVSENVPHVTLLYGLMNSGEAMRKHVDAVLDGWTIANVEINEVGFFYSKDPAEGYVAIVAHIKVNGALYEGNARLRMLPHIDTFPEYKPHITLAYVTDKSDYQNYIETLNERLAGKTIKVVSVNYGD